MIKTILQDKYDVDSFSFCKEFIVTLVSDTSTKKLSFGDRIVYFKFHEKELANPTNFPYYNLLGKSLRTTTLIQNFDSELLERFLFGKRIKALYNNCAKSYHGNRFL